MKELCLSDGTRVIYVEGEAIPERSLRGYCVYYVNANDREIIDELIRRDYLFADRLMEVEIMLSDWEPKYYKPSKQGHISYELSSDWTVEAIYELAKGEFSADRRFAVNMKMRDASLENEILCRYIHMLKEDGFKACLCHKEGVLLGFNLWNIHNNHAGTILLGMVEPEMRNLLAVSLYEYTLYTMQQMGVNKLSNRVSTCNVSAVRLHMALGRDIRRLRVTGFEDQYIKDKR